MSCQTFDYQHDGSERVKETLHLLVWMCERFMKKHKRADVSNTDNRRVEFLVTNPENTKKILDVLTHFKLPLEEDGYAPHAVDCYKVTGGCATVYLGLELARFLVELKEQLK